MTEIKFCGMRELDRAREAVQLGVESIGFVLARSRRQVSESFVEEVVSELGPQAARYVGVVDSPGVEHAQRLFALGLHALQLCGDESVEQVAELAALGSVWKVVHVGDDSPAEAVSRYAAVCERVVLDARVPGSQGGTGLSFDWDLAGDIDPSLPIVLAGGLNPANVATAIEQVGPCCVDVSSGIEVDGRHDLATMTSFVDQVRLQDRRTT